MLLKKSVLIIEDERLEQIFLKAKVSAVLKKILKNKGAESHQELSKDGDKEVQLEFSKGVDIEIQQEFLKDRSAKAQQELLTDEDINTQYEEYNILVSSNGIEALELCQKHMPSILFVDINIPGLNGISLIRTLREFQYPGKIIITTAYDSFDYAQKAIVLNVNAYLLKPIEEIELEDALQGCLEEIEKESRQSVGIETAFSYAESYLVNDLLEGNIPSNALRRAFSWPEDGTLQIRFLQFRVHGEDMEKAKEFDKKNVGGNDREEVQNYFLSRCKRFYKQRNLLLTARVGEDVIALIQPKKPMPIEFLDSENYFFCWQIMHEIEEEDIAFLYASEIYSTFGEICDSYRKLSAQKDKNHQFKRKLSVKLPDYSALCPAKDRTKLRQKWFVKFEEGNTAYIISMLERALGKKENYWPGVLLFLEMLYQLDSTIQLEEVFQIFCADRVFELLESWINRYFVSIDNRGGKSSSYAEPIGKRIMNVLQEHFDDEDLTEKMIAEEFGFSQEYFSRIVKKELRRSFVAILTDLRCNQAKRLLPDTSLSLQEISQRCGYRDRKYFFRVFKKREGCTPMEYRNQFVNQEGESSV